MKHITTQQLAEIEATLKGGYCESSIQEVVLNDQDFEVEIFYEVSSEYGLNADIGGIDGVEFDVTIVGATIGGLHINRDMAAMMLGSDQFDNIETSILEGL